MAAHSEGIAFRSASLVVGRPGELYASGLCVDDPALLRMGADWIAFTPTDCATYGIDPCATLEEMR